MTRYTVVWHRDAEDELAEAWLRAPNRPDVALAAAAIDRHLGSDATSKGIEVEGGLRQLVITPLRVLFVISETDCLVRVVHVALEE